jgi:uncharacterized membrane protein YgcG
MRPVELVDSTNPLTVTLRAAGRHGNTQPLRSPVETAAQRDEDALKAGLQHVQRTLHVKGPLLLHALWSLPKDRAPRELERTQNTAFMKLALDITIGDVNGLTQDNLDALTRFVKQCASFINDNKALGCAQAGLLRTRITAETRTALAAHNSTICGFLASDYQDDPPPWCDPRDAEGLRLQGSSWATSPTQDLVILWALASLIARARSDVTANQPWYVLLLTRFQRKSRAALPLAPHTSWLTPMADLLKEAEELELHGTVSLDNAANSVLLGAGVPASWTYPGGFVNFELGAHMVDSLATIAWHRFARDLPSYDDAVRHLHGLNATGLRKVFLMWAETAPRRNCPDTKRLLETRAAAGAVSGAGATDTRDRRNSNASSAASSHSPRVGAGVQTCHNCKQPGHIARDCPSSPTRSATRGSTERSASTPRASFSRGDERQCYNCGATNHFSNACTAPCRNCGNGHKLRDCPTLPPRLAGMQSRAPSREQQASARSTSGGSRGGAASVGSREGTRGGGGGGGGGGGRGGTRASPHARK